MIVIYDRKMDNWMNIQINTQLIMISNC